ncbi:hypothetical protein [Ureaplasma ceti]|uniref:30S ribosomal protein S1 n=1 Tax=Ureaplasma ceti TaxID=3119530 RepID=A0ABP9U904_9BACT
MATRAEFFRSAFIDKKKAKKIRKIWIVEAKVIKINSKSVDVIVKDNGYFGKCNIKDISDFSVMNLGNIFKINFTYKFIVKAFNRETKIYSLNYKSLHPEQMKHKLRPVPTASHYRNLSFFLEEQIALYKAH